MPLRGSRRRRRQRTIEINRAQIWLACDTLDTLMAVIVLNYALH
jgi:hypothetical protein